jgi:hypothetical protein
VPATECAEWSVNAEPNWTFAHLAVEGERTRRVGGAGIVGGARTVDAEG